MPESLPLDIQAWLQAFREKHGRSLRVLHIGNIANNAYINAKLLNQAGLDCDVICCDYYHIMGCPEWEDADFEGEVKDQFYPNWRDVNLNGFKRPKWFAQGPQYSCLHYLLYRRKGDRWKERFWWEVLNVSRWVISAIIRMHLKKRVMRLRRFFSDVRHALFPLYKRTESKKLRPTVLGKFDQRIQELIKAFGEAFPERRDKLRTEDFDPYREAIPLWEILFNQYDVVQAYAISPVLPMLAGKRPYLGFEHGTLRDFVFCESAICRTTALGYHLADQVFITNGDCLDYAREIGVKRYSAMIHPLQIERIRSTKGKYDDVHKYYEKKYVFLCTLRHDWEVKGTDKYILALPELREILDENFVVIMTQWGQEVGKSRTLARELGVTHLIDWVNPLPRIELIRMLKSADLLFDQIALPHFGATAPEGIAAEVPVIMSYDPRSTEWIIPEAAPILSAWTVEDIVTCVKVGIDPRWREQYRKEARRWIDRYHSARTVVEKHVGVYKQILDGKVLDLHKKEILHGKKGGERL